LSNVSLTITGPKPHFRTSDDALIAGAKADPSAAQSSVFVTSDRALARTLSALGGVIVKPKQFLALTNNLANGAGSNLDDWIAQLVELPIMPTTTEVNHH